MAVKGSRYPSMRVIPHRPIVRGLIYVGFVVVFAVAVVGSYYAGIYRLERSQALASSDTSHRHQQALSDATQELTRLRTNADIDRQTIEDMRQLTMTQKAQMAAYERDLRVYKDLLSPGAKANPLGVSFGLFTVLEAARKGSFTYKLVVQKLSAREEDFRGSLDFRVLGEQAGKPVSLALYQLSEQQTSPIIALDFKYFQTLEGEFQLPPDFVPKHVELTVNSGKSNPPVVQTQLEWPI
ncbi:MAG TPA: DUF6776 family protein [Cellvibrio sp.]|nr:DUF6776 family protein [Cellvibrio sp.]